MNINDQHTLDPAYYDVKYLTVNKNIHIFSLGEKYPSILNDNRKLPGVGDYQINRNDSNSKNNSKFGTSSRFTNNSKLNLPGPGDYQLLTIQSTNNKPKTTFGTSPKKSDYNPHLTPSPAQYNKPSLF